MDVILVAPDAIVGNAARRLAGVVIIVTKIVQALNLSLPSAPGIQPTLLQMFHLLLLHPKRKVHGRVGHDPTDAVVSNSVMLGVLQKNAARKQDGVVLRLPIVSILRMLLQSLFQRRGLH